MCKETDGWVLIDTTKKGFNAKNAIIGGVLLGGIGLVAGATGKKKSFYACNKCSFQYEYDGEAIKNISVEEAMKSDGFSPKGSNKVYIDTITLATSSCQFCNKPQNLFAKYVFSNADYSFRCGYCMAEFRCNFSFGGKIKAKTVKITNCGNENINGFNIGNCEASQLIKDSSKIK